MKTKIGELARVCTVGNIETTAPGHFVRTGQENCHKTKTLFDLLLFWVLLLGLWSWHITILTNVAFSVSGREKCFVFGGFLPFVFPLPVLVLRAYTPVVFL